ncbi:hypothetical protein JCM8547_007327 [Rhodosporidiobolus lusitaniae]
MSATCSDNFAVAVQFVANSQQRPFAPRGTVFLDGTTNMASWFRFEDLQMGRPLPSDHLVKRMLLPTNKNPVQFRTHGYTASELLELPVRLTKTATWQQGVVLERDLLDVVQPINHDLVPFHLSLHPVLKPAHEWDWETHQGLVRRETAASYAHNLDDTSDNASFLYAHNPSYHVLSPTATFVLTLEALTRPSSRTDIGHDYFTLRLVGTFSVETEECQSTWVHKYLTPQAISVAILAWWGRNRFRALTREFLQILSPNNEAVGIEWEEPHSHDPRMLEQEYRRAFHRLRVLVETAEADFDRRFPSDPHVPVNRRDGSTA